jgi:multidrug efflux system membrane fusion protein
MELKQTQTTNRKTVRNLRMAIALSAIVLGLLVLLEVTRQPRTDDAEVTANFIGIAPQVEGPIIHLNVHDNQFVKQGEPLFEVDDRPYQYALENALSEQAALEGQIGDEGRRIAALVSAVSVAQANIQSSQADVERGPRRSIKQRPTCRIQSKA